MTITTADIRIALVVEDEKTSQKLLRSYLSRLGYTVDVVDNGTDAVRSAAEVEYGLIFMDWDLWSLTGLGMTGIQATKLIKMARKPCPPIIAVTSHTDPGDKEECLAAGMDAYLAKPISFDQLVDAIAEARSE